MSLDSLSVNGIRTLAIDAIQQANSGHPGLPMGAAPMAYVLWTRYLRHNPANPAWPNRDRFVFSAGHGSMLIYALLHLTGYDLPLDELKRFRQWGSRTPGHPEWGLTPGVEATTGPLGQGFANGVGMAMAEAHLAATYNRPGHEIVDHFTYGLVSDGDLMEGVSSEAASLAGHLRLGKVIYLYDDNRVSLSAATHLTFTEDVAKRFEAHGWHVQSLEDGNDLEAVQDALEAARAETSRPSLIRVRTTIGFGSPNKSGTFEVHGSPLGADEVRLTKAQLDWPESEAFSIPSEVRAHFQTALERGGQWETEWQARLQRYAGEHPDLAAQFKRVLVGELPPGWDTDLPTFGPEAGSLATRVASGQVLNAIAPRLPELLGGSADLNPSTNTALKGAGDFQYAGYDPPDRQGAVGGVWGYAGRNLHYGVREHAMGAITNGLAYHGGLIPFSATFLAFSDYMRPPIRLASLSELGSIFVFTHDSIGLGEDGPTHQPVEQLAALRAIPNLVVIRPGDANEAREAWRVAITRRRGPTVLLFTRQALPVFDRARFASERGLERGAYVLADPPDGSPELILIGTGSEMALVVGAWEQLVAAGIRVRAVSMPSWELFESQSQDYRDRVLPPNVRARLAVEAGVPQGWERWVGDSGEVIGLDRYGASAPYQVIFEHLGFTVDNVVERARALLAKSR